MTNIVLETNGSRPRLLDQTITTLYQNTPVDQFNLTIVMDGCRSDKITGPNNYAVMLDPACSVTGRLKNLGAYWSEKQFGRGDWLLFCDDDVAFMPGWLHKMTINMETFTEGKSPVTGETVNTGLRLLGGNRHPYHGVNETLAFGNQTTQITDAVAGYSMLMRWETFDKYGPFDAHAKGIAQSEDFAFARRIVDDGGKVGYIHPPVLYHTGVTNSSGQPATGAEKIERVEGILYL